jgi:hypothetical protein
MEVDKEKEQEESIQYQWIKGDNIGNVVTFKEEKEEKGINWTYFTNGKRVRSDLLSEFLMVTGDAPIIDNSDLHPDPLKTLNPIKSTDSAESTKLKDDTISPIRSLIKKQSAKNKQKLSLDIEISIPKKDIYNIIRESYNSEEVDRELKEVLLEQLNTKEIKEQLKDNAISMLNKYYSIKIKQDDTNEK